MTAGGPYCDCDGPPWPAMTRLHAGGPHRFYLCRRCGAIRAEILRSGRDRGIARVSWYALEDDDLPPAVREEALEILETPQGEQLQLF